MIANSLLSVFNKDVEAKKYVTIKNDTKKALDQNERVPKWQNKRKNKINCQY